MSATMRDVAALAGVSLKTVSRVVNHEPHTSPDVVRRVRAAVAELGWVPNGAARTLRTGRTGMIAVTVPELSRPYGALLTEAVVSEVARRGLNAAVEPVGADPARVRAVLASIGTSLDGAVVLEPDPGAVVGLRATDPVVAVQGGPGLPVDCVDPDLVEASALIARHLAVMGRVRPALLGADRLPDGAETFAAALGRLTLRVDGVRDRVEGARLAARLLKAGTDAAVCGSDELAAGLLAGLAAAGAGTDRIVVTGMDNLDDGLFTTPSLTTVDPGADRLARTALDLLGDRIAGYPHQGPRHVLSPVTLVRRESTLGAA